MTKEKMDFDVVIVGAGPAGLSAAIRLAQAQKNLSIAVIEKASSIGGHSLSGAVLEPRALNVLLPDWQKNQPPSFTPVTQDEFLFLTPNNYFALPKIKTLNNQGNYIIRLGLFCQWLATQAEQLGVQIFPGFAGSELLIDNNRVIGIVTGDMGLDKNHQPKPSFQPGILLRPAWNELQFCRVNFIQFPVLFRPL